MYMREQKPWLQTTVVTKTWHGDSLVDKSYSMAYVLIINTKAAHAESSI